MRLEELDKMYRLEDTYWWFVGRRRLVEQLVRRYGVASPRMLDVGCGTGGTMDALGPLGEVWGADISQDALDFCRERGHESVRLCAAEALDFEDASFDLALACDVLEHVDDVQALREILRVLRPGGIVVATAPAYRFLWSEHDLALSHRRRYERRDLRDRLREAGFEVVKLTYAVSFVFPVVVLFRLLNRARVRRLGTPHTQLLRIPGWLNWLFTLIQDIENWFVIRTGFLFGTSLVAVARKPGAGEHP